MARAKRGAAAPVVHARERANALAQVGVLFYLDARRGRAARAFLRAWLARVPAYAVERDVPGLVWVEGDWGRDARAALAHEFGRRALCEACAADADAGACAAWDAIDPPAPEPAPAEAEAWWETAARAAADPDAFVAEVYAETHRYAATAGGFVWEAFVAGAARGYEPPPPRPPPPTSPPGVMTRAQAAAVLGVAPGAPRAAVVAAYRAAALRAHPDRGGSDAAMARVNAAKEALLGA